MIGDNYMSKNVSYLLDCVKSKVGCYYWMGTFGQMASKSLYLEKKKQYPNYYNASDFQQQINNPKQVFDCAGLIKFVWWSNNINDTKPKYVASQDLGATGIYGKATKKGYISDIALYDGLLLFKGNDKQKTHVGVYIGNNHIIEAKGHSYGVVETSKDSSWKYYAESPFIDYSVEPKPDPDLKFDNTICMYCKGITLTVNTKYDPLNLRQCPDGKIICQMPKGSKVTWFGYYSGNWYYINYNGIYGFAHKDYLKI